MQIDDKIISMYPSLSKSSKKIADYYLYHQKDFLTNNAEKLGQLTATSAATIIRFCKQLNFAGLKAFQIELAIEMPKDVPEKINTIINNDDDPSVVLNKLYNSLNENLKELASLVDRNVLSKIINLMNNSNMIYLEGIGASSLPAQDLFFKLIRINKNASYISDIHIALENITHSKSKDLVIIFSYSGLTKEILLIAEQAKKNGTKVVAITRNHKSPLTQIADLVLTTPISEHLHRFGAINSLFSEFFISSLLYLSLISPNLKQLREKIDLTDRVLRSLKEGDTNVD